MIQDFKSLIIDKLRTDKIHLAIQLVEQISQAIKSPEPTVLGFYSVQ